MIIHTYAYPRAALIGNPSDGYYGKTIAFVFDNFWAEVILYESPELEILPQKRDRSIYRHIEGLYEDVKLHGYYGGIRLLKATIKKFLEHCRANRVVLDKRNFTIRYDSNIPHRVGLAGSSAIITACIRALLQFYRIKIPNPLLANIILSVESEELGISAGLQDRVAQVYERLVYMDFNKSDFLRRGYGSYEVLTTKLLPPVYIAYMTDFSEGSEVVHNDLKKRFQKGDEQVVAAMDHFAELTVRARQALLKGDFARLGKIMDENFDLRASIMEIDSENMQLIQLARSVGATAKFTGSGGAIIGTYTSEEMFTELLEKMEPYRISVIKPNIVANQ